MIYIKPDRSNLGEKLLRLSEQEYNYVKNDEVPEKATRKVMEKRATESRNELPKRLKVLFDDIKQLDENGMLEGDEWFKVWMEWLSDGIIDRDMDKQVVERLYENEATPVAYNAGSRLGSMMARLIPHEMSENVETDLQDIKLDFLLGFIQELFHDDGEEIIEDFDGVSGELERRTSEISTESHEVDDIDPSIIEESYEVAWDNVYRIMDEDVGLAKFGELDLDVSVDLLPERDEQQMTNISRVPFSGVDIVMEAIDEEFEGVWYYPDEATGDVEWQNVPITDQQVLEVIEEQNLEQKIQFWEQVEADIRHTDSRPCSNKSLSDILGYLHKQDDSQTIREIIDGTSDIGRNKPCLEDVMIPILSGEQIEEYARDSIEVEQDRRWSDRPLIRQKEDGWVLTEYGTLLAECMTEARDLHMYMDIEGELIRGAKEEINWGGQDS
jgi:hypothetical protein